MIEFAPLCAAVEAGAASGAGGFGETAGAVAHAAGGVDQDQEVEVGLLLVLLEIELVAAAVDLPVKVADVVAGGVGAVLGEFNAEALEGRAVQAARQALDDHAGPQFERAKTRKGLRVEVERGIDVGRLADRQGDGFGGGVGHRVPDGIDRAGGRR